MGGATSYVGNTDESGVTGTAPITAGFSGAVVVVAQIEDGPSVTFHLTVTGSVFHGTNPHTGETRQAGREHAAVRGRPDTPAVRGRRRQRASDNPDHSVGVPRFTADRRASRP